MTSQTSLRLPTGRSLLLVAGLVSLLVAALVWVTTRETAAEKEIRRLLAELRAAGEPIESQDLARSFPDPSPEEDAAALFAKAFVVASNYPAPGSTPLVMSGGIERTEAMDDMTLRPLNGFCAASGEITNVLPRVVPPEARFPMRWNKGMTNHAGVMNFLAVRRFVQFIAAHVVIAAESGDAQRVADWIERGFTFNRTVNYDGLFVTHMIRHACDGLMCSVTERALNRIRFSDAQLQRIAGALRGETADDLRNCLRAEHCFAIWAFQAAAAGMPSEVLFGGSTNRVWWKRIWNRIQRRRPDYRDADFLAYLRTIPLRLRLTAAPPRKAMKETLSSAHEYASAAVSEVGGLLTPTITGKSVAIHTEGNAKMTLLAVALAIERARLAHSNEVPSSLASLVPRYLPSIPADPFDDRPLRFKKLQPGYVIYSVGRDGEDDGGVERSNPNATTNCDVTITVER